MRGKLQAERGRRHPAVRVGSVAGAALFIGVNLSAGVARAQDATWSGPGAEWTTGANWSTASVPSDTATFTNNSAPTSVTIGASASINNIQFNTGAPAYTFTINGAFNINGAGIVDNSANAPSFTYNTNGYFNNNSTAGDAIITNHFDLEFLNTSTAGNATITNSTFGNLSFFNTSTAGNATITNNMSMDFFAASTAGNATITNNGGLAFFNTSTAGNATITTNSGGSIYFFTNSTGGSAQFITNGTGVVDFSATAGPAGNNQISAGSIAGSGDYYLGANQLTVGSNNLSTTVSGTVSDCGGGLDCVIPSVGGSLVKVGSGTLTLSGINTYTGATTVNSGTLEVDGSIANTSSVTVNSGGTLSGTGVVDPITTTIAGGGTLAPGNPANPTGTLTIAGNLALQSGAFYMVQVTPSAASATNVGGTASLDGTVQAVFASGGYVSKQYTILTATGGLGGTTFAGLTNTNLPAGASDSLSYSADNVYLNLTAGFTSYTGLNANQQNVANALTNYFNSTGGIPAAFFGLTPGGLTQIDGEAATGAERVAFQLTNEFLGLMLDPFVDGRLGGGGGFGGGGQASRFAPEQQTEFPPDIALAYAAVLKAPAPFAQRWTAWGSAYGGSSTSSGDPAVGSNNVTTQTYGFAGGMDYHYSPDTIFGFALAGGGTNWGLAGGLGGGRSDAMQTGVYGITRSGPAYLAAALSFTNHWMTTDRAALGDQLTANFDAQSYGARVETGYRYALLSTFGATPYAALQVQDFHTPNYSESDVSGGGFGVSYAAMNAVETRSELGARFDDPTLLYGMPLVLRSKVAWAHDWVSNPSLNAVFESLPGASFTVNGAPIPQNSALASAGAQLFFAANWSLLAKFDGEFASGSQTYSGSGTLRYTW